MATMTHDQVTPSEVHEFKAETRQLLSLVIHSLYTHKEIFLRELISNASDALDRLRFDSLTRPELIGASEPQIRLEVDSTARTLTIHDNGIGMTRDEVLTNIGTIARSGTQELIAELTRAGHESRPELIGRFGVGFYSAFMVADLVTLDTRRAGDAGPATRWESSGDGQFTIAEGTRAEPGTSITLQLKPVDADAGLEDYTEDWVLSRIVKQYSDFVAHPIVMGERTLNSQKPLWSRSRSEVTTEEYRDFYQQLTHDRTPPLLHIAAKAEGRVECQALLYVPAEAAYDLHYFAAAYGLRLYARRVLILDRCADVLPRYLRFVTGVVDVLDLPLNISRQMLQESRHLTEIRQWVTRAVLGKLADLKQQDSETYLKFWRQFGRALKEGVDADYQNRDRLLPLLLFESTHHASDLTTLDDYVSRMPADQTEIYYLTGDDREAIEQAPHVEAARDRGYEVLCLVDPVDELLVQTLPEHAGKRLRSLGKGTLDWQPASADTKSETDKTGDTDASADADAAAKPAPVSDEDLAPLSTHLEQLLNAHVKRVRRSTRLTSSPACLVGEEHDATPRMERLLMKGQGGGPRQRRILELNTAHPVIAKLRERQHAAPDDPRWPDYAELLLGYALLTEGSQPANPVRFSRLLVDLMANSL